MSQEQSKATPQSNPNAEQAPGEKATRGPIAKPGTALWMAPYKDKVWDVVIVGSGYGGSAAAATFAGRGLSVCVLERGKEYLPGEFPARFAELPGHVRLTRQMSGNVANPTGLMDLRLGEDVNALVGNGLGGGSLINAGVMLRPDANDIDEGPVRSLVASLVSDSWYQRAERELGSLVRESASAPPDGVPNSIARHADHPLLKFNALERLQDSKCRQTAVPITVALARDSNAAGTQLEACTLCGDCLTGCNVGAKNSLDANLLVKAAERGVELFTGLSVLNLRRSLKAGDLVDGKQTEPDPEGAVWSLRTFHTDTRLQARESGRLLIHARHVVLAAGTLGSTEILLRSRTDKLALSPRLGERFSCNGDSIAALYKLPTPTHSVADENTPLLGRKVGPTITGTIRVPANTSNGQRSFQIQEFSIPGPLKRLFSELATTADALHQVALSESSTHGGEAHNALDPLAVNDDVIERSLLVGLIGHDEANGVLHWSGPREAAPGVQQQGTLQIRWPDARNGQALERAHERLQALHDAMPLARDANGHTLPATEQSRVLDNPLWKLLPKTLELLVSQPRGPVLTVHPLGGCSIGANAQEGVVNQWGQVWNAADNTAAGSVHEGLMVMDGSVFGQSLGVNPSLTITAFSLRAADQFAQCWIGAPVPEPLGNTAHDVTTLGTPRQHIEHWHAPTSNPHPNGTEIEIVERLTGSVCLDVGDRQPTPMVVELTLAYEAVPLKALMTQLNRNLTVRQQGGELTFGDIDKPFEGSRLRIYKQADWDSKDLRVQSEETRSQYAVFVAELQGSLRLLHREPSGKWQRRARGLWAWLRNRGVRDTFGYWGLDKEPKRSRPDGSAVPSAGLGSRIRDSWRVATRAGEVRRFDYELSLGKILTNNIQTQSGQPHALFSNDTRISGHKRLTYNRRANPLKQLTELTLTRMDGLNGRTGLLKLDTRFMAGQAVPLMRVVRQSNHADALAELASFGALMVRLLVHTHLWTFRKSDGFTSGKPRPVPQRLPMPIEGLPQPEIVEFVVDAVPKTKAAVKIRLTRYPRRTGSGSGSGSGSKAPPLVMIHGYSVSGNTFTHSSLKMSAAEYFWRQERDVWVVDLRSSTGLPTCRLPWSMEQVALVDIPAALLHVRHATGQRVDVLAHCIGCVMLSMALLTDAKQIATDEVELGVDTWLTDEHLGALTAFNGSKPAGGDHPTIHRIVLSQKGPLLRYTDDNVLRAYLMLTLKRWLLDDSYQFQPPEQPGLVDQLLDRLLASLPYNDADYDVANPIFSLRQRTWTATRKRMDALYGRDFNAENMSLETLEAIDDLFGAINLDTVSQTTHFARWNAITNQRGRGEFVTQHRLRARWSGIPTLAVHGQDNGLADVSTQGLLRQRLRQAGVPFEEYTAPGKGHQDCLIGVDAARIFEKMEEFLVPKPTLGAAPPLPNKVETFTVFAVPWIGPRLASAAGDSIAGPQSQTRLAALSRPDQGEAALVLVPVRHIRPTPTGARQYQVEPDPAGLEQGTLGASGEWMFAAPPVGWAASAPAAPGTLGWLALLRYDSEQTTGADPLPSTGPSIGSDPVSPGNGSEPPKGPNPNAPLEKPHAPDQGTRAPIVGVIGGNGSGGSFPLSDKRALRLSDVDDQLTKALRARRAKAVGGGSMAVAGAEDEHASAAERQADSNSETLRQAAQWIAVQPVHELDLAYVAAGDLVQTNRLTSQHEAAKGMDSSTFIVGSCQYPAGLMDSEPARASTDRARAHLEEARFALLLGDQIYADATAGLADATRQDELYDYPHERALRQPALRALMRRIPVATLLDDHEINDNWEPQWQRGGAQRTEDRRAAWRLARERGMRAFYKYERMQATKLSPNIDLPGADLALEWGGLPIYLLDTRSQRSLRPQRAAGQAHRLITLAQMQRLKDWLLLKKEQVKFIATPSMFLPRQRVAASGDAHPDDGHLHSDGWDGYPEDLHHLLDFMRKERIGKTVFLSGDEHHSSVSVIELSAAANDDVGCTSEGQPPQGDRLPIKILSVHSSALYAPFPFANGRASDQTNAVFTTRSGGTDVHIDTQYSSGDGFALIKVLYSGGPGPQLHVRFVKATPQVPAFDLTYPL
jgi:cholesterol oxidase